jgi:hypothetical protein
LKEADGCLFSAENSYEPLSSAVDASSIEGLISGPGYLVGDVVLVDEWRVFRQFYKGGGAVSDFVALLRWGWNASLFRPRFSLENFYDDNTEIDHLLIAVNNSVEAMCLTERKLITQISDSPLEFRNSTFRAEIATQIIKAKSVILGKEFRLGHNVSSIFVRTSTDDLVSGAEYGIIFNKGKYASYPQSFIGIDSGVPNFGNTRMGYYSTNASLTIKLVASKQDMASTMVSRLYFYKCAKSHNFTEDCDFLGNLTINFLKRDTVMTADQLGLGGWSLGVDLGMAVDSIGNPLYDLWMYSLNDDETGGIWQFMTDKAWLGGDFAFSHCEGGTPCDDGRAFWTNFRVSRSGTAPGMLITTPSAYDRAIACRYVTSSNMELFNPGNGKSVTLQAENFITNDIYGIVRVPTTIYASSLNGVLNGSEFWTEDGGKRLPKIAVVLRLSGAIPLIAHELIADDIYVIRMLPGDVLNYFFQPDISKMEYVTIYIPIRRTALNTEIIQPTLLRMITIGEGNDGFCSEETEIESFVGSSSSQVIPAGCIERLAVNETAQSWRLNIDSAQKAEFGDISTSDLSIGGSEWIVHAWQLRSSGSSLRIIPVRPRKDVFILGESSWRIRLSSSTLRPFILSDDPRPLYVACDRCGSIDVYESHSGKWTIISERLNNFFEVPLPSAGFLDVCGYCAGIEEANCSITDTRLSETSKWYLFASGFRGVHDETGSIVPNIGIQLIRGNTDPLTYRKTWSGEVPIQIVESAGLRLVLTVFLTPSVTVITPILGDLVVPFLPGIFSGEWDNKTLESIRRLGVIVPEDLGMESLIGYYGENGSLIINSSIFAYTLGGTSAKLADLLGLEESWVTSVEFVCWEDRIRDGLCIPIDEGKKAENTGLKIWQIAVCAGSGVVLVIVVLIIIIVVKKKRKKEVVRETNEENELEEALAQPTMDEMGLSDEGVIHGGGLELADSESD